MVEPWATSEGGVTAEYTGAGLTFRRTTAMRRQTVRFFALATLALLGAPVVMHVVMHDLHHHAEEHGLAVERDASHGDHEHPIVSSSAPQVPSLTRLALTVFALPAATPATWTNATRVQRNVIAHGALRLDDDVGLHRLLSTFLI